MLQELLRRGKRRPILQAPTGSGKLPRHKYQARAGKSKRVLFTVPALALPIRRLKSCGMRVSAMSASHRARRSRTPIVRFRSRACRRSCGGICPTMTWSSSTRPTGGSSSMRSGSSLTRRLSVGPSATPWTKGLGYYDDLIVPTSMRELQKDGFLVPERVKVAEHVDLSDVKTVAGDYHEGQLAEKMNTVKLVGNVVETWKRESEGRVTLVFAVDRAHAKSIHARFLKAGIPAGDVDGESDKDTRRAVRAGFHRGDIRVVCSIGVLTMGIDWDVRCIQLARPTKSDILFVQMIGRGFAQPKRRRLPDTRSHRHISAPGVRRRHPPRDAQRRFTPDPAKAARSEPAERVPELAIT